MMLLENNLFFYFIYSKKVGECKRTHLLIKIVIWYYNSFITLQGTPTATTFDGISLFTTLPAPITTLSPIVTPGSTTTFPPIHTLFPTFIGLAYSNPLFLLS